MEILDDVRVFFDEGRAADIPQNKLERAFMMLVGAPPDIHDGQLFQRVQDELNRRTDDGKGVAGLAKKLSAD